ncbi:MAG: hypothetical protein ACPGYY_07720, partial [Bacteroidia bacterium]
MKFLLSTVVSLFILRQSASACSMYKVSHEGVTHVGCNEDAWRFTSTIWFENAKSEKDYGACFTGSRMVGGRRVAPQSGMNEVGLVFSRLVSYYPKIDSLCKAKKEVHDEVHFLSNIIHKCETVDQVDSFVQLYNRECFLEDVFIYIDRMGNYLIVEPYGTIRGNDPNYVLSNFCPSITSAKSARKQMRYRNGEDYLKKYEPDGSIDYYRNLSDTMHVCRSRNGDGTLLTSIWNTKDVSVNLYFYHNYDSTVFFDIKEELAKGNHSISIPYLFPENKDYQQLVAYVTPFTHNTIRILLVIIAALLCVFGVVYLFKISRVSLCLVLLNGLLVVYLGVLATHISIFYFDAPYVDPSSTIISWSSYIPFLLLFSFIGLQGYWIRRGFPESDIRIKWIVVSNVVLYG